MIALGKILWKPQTSILRVSSEMTHLKVLFKALSQRVGDLVEADELTHAQHLCMVACSA